MIFETVSPEETAKIGREIGEKAKKGDIYCLEGDLGVGKTVFTKGFAEGIDIHDHITSPTFNIVNEYYGKLPMYHFDMYRISCVEELDDIGYEEYFFGDGVCLIEWASLVQEAIPENAKWIKIEKNLEKGLDYRKITIE
ncbi:MAG: tRNA (adenosine(37)-N6)-threonylcarbamoyltransferase complex ATPase subunit type 1 TsaE [Tyzzerella sp.]|uniref:tRNA threonylcarbamoyladenosine biosynthesis protein TsaE n=1 Tax=Candidatus Fimicola merdigallinarum TaxID=2840819 RepID=A0A9D9DXF6_9FIRM|nr:tRNA (adenosine(37)-N6)-threonylcarbamoyltransferase complex ATPase subunit type 1 TsaE [Candidatus Fimicola merdigallinarum]